MSYVIQALEYGEQPGMASVCAIDGDFVFEDPNNAGIPIEQAMQISEELAQSGISDVVIEEKWIALT